MVCRSFRFSNHSSPSLASILVRDPSPGKEHQSLLRGSHSLERKRERSESNPECSCKSGGSCHSGIPVPVSPSEERATRLEVARKVIKVDLKRLAAWIISRWFAADKPGGAAADGLSRLRGAASDRDRQGEAARALTAATTSASFIGMGTPSGMIGRGRVASCRLGRGFDRPGGI